MAKFVIGDDGAAAASDAASDKDDSMEGFIVDDDELFKSAVPRILRAQSSSPALLQKQNSLPFMGTEAVEMEQRRSAFTREYHGSMVGGKDSNSKRHYKKDSRYLLDLYTLTFDEDETVDEIKPCQTIDMMESQDPNPPFSTTTSTAPPSSSSPKFQPPHDLLSMMATAVPAAAPEDGMDASRAVGPMSLGSALSSQQRSPGSTLGRRRQVAHLPSLETNLHKILARKIQDSEEVSFRKSKLLTMAYYKLLRESPKPLVDPKVQVQQMMQPKSGSKPVKPIGVGNISLRSLVRTDAAELRRIVRGLGNTARALNDYLMELLVERDELRGRQDDMLEEISELTDKML